MDFNRTFNLEQGLRKGNPVGFAIVSAMEDSDAWRNHAKKCNMARVVSLGINGERIAVDEAMKRTIVLDAKAWRDDLEYAAKTILEAKPFVFDAEQGEGLQSQNFAIQTGSKIYEKQQEHNLGCMCGANVSVAPKDVARFNSYGVVATDTSQNVDVKKSGYTSMNFSSRVSYKV